MSEDSSIKIKKMILHILDNNLHLPVLSDEELPRENEIDEFIEKHVSKILKDESLKKAIFINSDNRLRDICAGVRDNHEEFNRLSGEIAGILFGIMQKHVDIPSADLVCCLFYLDNTIYLGILKFNYKSSYIHFVQSGQTGKINSIIKQKTALPSESQRVEECALINLTDLSINLIEKKYEVNGEKTYYFSTMFLNCTSEMSDKEKVKIFKKATENFNKKYFDEDFSKSAEIKKAVIESVYEKDAIDVMDVAESVFRQNPEMKKTYIEHIEKAGIKDRTITMSEGLAEKTFKKQRIKTDTGIEINLPIEYYKDNQKVEFINNIDGTISILIKNINRIMDA